MTCHRPFMAAAPIAARILLTLAVGLWGAGCEFKDLPMLVPPESPQAMGAGPAVAAALGEVRLSGQPRVFAISGAYTLPEEVRKVVEHVVREARIFGDDASHPAAIDAEVVESSIDGMSTVATLSVRYRVVSAAGQTVFDETIDSRGSDDTFFGMTRYERTAANAIGRNAAKFRDKLRVQLAGGGAPVRVAAPAAPVVTAPMMAAPMAAAPVAPRFPAQPRVLRFPKGPERPDDVAVIIGNADYGRQGRDIPDAKPAYADAEGMRLYVTKVLGIRDGNVIFLKDATGAQMTRVFGSRDDPRGQLHDWVKPGKSRVFVYFSGHGAPGSQGGTPYLLPTDADATRIELNGYPLRQMYDNLGKLPAESVTVVLEACFAGTSPAGSVLGRASPVFFEVKAPPVPPNLTVITAGAANQMANWEPDDSHGLFTRHFLEAMSGKADADRDGKVSLAELDRYLKDTLTYYARRHYGRDQQAQIVQGGAR